MYGYFHKISFKDYPFYTTLQNLLETFTIYKSNDKHTYYFTNTPKTKLFGFVLSYNNEPYYYEYTDDGFIPCNAIQLENINSSLKTYYTSKHYKDNYKSSV